MTCSLTIDFASLCIVVFFFFSFFLWGIFAESIWSKVWLCRINLLTLFQSMNWLMWKHCCSLLSCCIFLCVHSRGEEKKKKNQPKKRGRCDWGGCCVFGFMFVQLSQQLQSLCASSEALLHSYLEPALNVHLFYHFGPQPSFYTNKAGDGSLPGVKCVLTRWNKWHGGDLPKQPDKKSDTEVEKGFFSKEGALIYPRTISGASCSSPHPLEFSGSLLSSSGGVHDPP